MPGYIPDYSDQMDQDPSAINMTDPYAALRRRIASQAVGADPSYDAQVAAERGKFDARAARLQAADQMTGSNATGYDTGPGNTPIDLTDRSALRRMPVHIGSYGFASQLDPKVRAQIEAEVASDPHYQNNTSRISFGGKDYTMDSAPVLSQTAAQAMNQRYLDATKLKAENDKIANERNYNLELENRKNAHEDAVRQAQWAHDKELAEATNPMAWRQQAHENDVTTQAAQARVAAAQAQAAENQAKGILSPAELRQRAATRQAGLIAQLSGRDSAAARTSLAALNAGSIEDPNDPRFAAAATAATSPTVKEAMQRPEIASSLAAIQDHLAQHSTVYSDQDEQDFQNLRASAIQQAKSVLSGQDLNDFINQIDAMKQQSLTKNHPYSSRFNQIAQWAPIPLTMAGVAGLRSLGAFPNFTR